MQMDMQEFGSRPSAGKNENKFIGITNDGYTS